MADNTRDQQQRRRRRRNNLVIAPVVPDRTFNFDQLMSELIVVEQRAIIRERELRTLAQQAEDYRNEISHMFDVIPRMLATARAARESSDQELIAQAGRFQQVINQLSDQLNILGNQTAYSLQAGMNLTRSFDEATRQYEFLSSALRTVPDLFSEDARLRYDFAVEQDEEESDTMPEPEQRGRNDEVPRPPTRSRADSSPERSAQRPSKASKRQTIIETVDAWLVSNQRRTPLIADLGELSREELFELADHYAIILTASVRRGTVNAIRNALAERLLRLRQERAAASASRDE